MAKNRTTKSIRQDMADLQEKIKAAEAAVAKHEADFKRCQKEDPPDIDGAVRAKALQDRGQIEADAFKQRLPAFEAEYAAATEREAKAAHTAARKALQEKVDAAEKGMLAAFSGEALARQIQALEASASVINEINANRAQNREGSGGV